MTAPHIVDPARVLGNLLTEASPDMMRQLLQNMINALLSADADAVCGAEWGQPSPERVAQALARRGAQKLLPSGPFAANLLGLTEQVPAKIEYLTDGPSRRVMIKRLPVLLKQATPARLATAGRVSGMVAQALRFLRKEQVDETIIPKLRGRLSAADKAQLVRDIPLVPAWVGEVFRKIAEAP